MWVEGSKEIREEDTPIIRWKHKYFQTEWPGSWRYSEIREEMKDKQIRHGMRTSVQKVDSFMQWEGNIKPWSNYILSGLYNHWNHGQRIVLSHFFGMRIECVWTSRNAFTMEERLGTVWLSSSVPRTHSLWEHFHWPPRLPAQIYIPNTFLRCLKEVLNADESTPERHRC